MFLRVGKWSWLLVILINYANNLSAITIRYKEFTLFLLVMYLFPISIILAGKKFELNSNGVFLYKNDEYHEGREFITTGSNSNYVVTNSHNSDHKTDLSQFNNHNQIALYVPA